MAERIGITVNPDVLALLFRAGAVVTGDHGFAPRLVEEGVPESHELANCGFNHREGQFFMIFAEKDDPEPGPIVWRAPVYEFGWYFFGLDQRLRNFDDRVVFGDFTHHSRDFN